jgi:ABC-2 type transport system permease protein
MNPRLIGALVRKDLALFFRNRFFAVISLLGLVLYITIYYVMPDFVQDKFVLGVFPADADPAIVAALEAREIEVQLVDSEADLRTRVEADELRAGVVLPANAFETMSTGADTAITIYFPPTSPSDLDAAFTELLEIVFNDVSFSLAGVDLNIEGQEEILGVNLAGEPLPARDRLLPLFTIFILIVETYGLAALITDEIEGRTLQALLITPLTVPGVFAAKAVMGVSLAFVQAALIVAVTGGLESEPGLVLLALLLGSLLVTGVGFLIASVARDLMSVIAWGVPAIIVLALPTFTVLFPGTVGSWIRAVPSFYLIDPLHRLINFGAGLSDVAANLAILLAFGLAALWLGTVVLRRRIFQ